MKNLYNKINEKWLKFRKWSEKSIIGDFVVNSGRIIFIITIFCLIFYGLTLLDRSNDKKTSQDTSSSATSTAANENCSVAGINLHGTLLTYLPLHADNDLSFNYDSVSSENIISSIRAANEDPKIKAIVIESDSGGGIPVAGEEIANAIKHSSKPVVAFIRSTGASSAYWAISSADKIFASRNSDVGSIGVTQSYLSSAEKNKKDGYVYEQISSGKYKDSGSPDKVLTEDERTLLQKTINIMFDNFVNDVAQNRKLPVEKVRAMADGSTVLGEEAKAKGLIDEIGGIFEVENYLETKIGEKPTICWQ